MEPGECAKSQNCDEKDDKAPQTAMVARLGGLPPVRPLVRAFFGLQAFVPAVFRLWLFRLRALGLRRLLPGPHELPPGRVCWAYRNRGGADGHDMQRLQRRASGRHAAGRRLQGQRLVGHRRIGQHDVAVVALSERNGDAFHERDLGALVRPLNYF